MTVRIIDEILMPLVDLQECLLSPLLEKTLQGDPALVLTQKITKIFDLELFIFGKIELFVFPIALVEAHEDEAKQKIAGAVDEMDGEDRDHIWIPNEKDPVGEDSRKFENEDEHKLGPECELLVDPLEFTCLDEEEKEQEAIDGQLPHVNTSGKDKVVDINGFAAHEVVKLRAQFELPSAIVCEVFHEQVDDRNYQTIGETESQQYGLFLEHPDKQMMSTASEFGKRIDEGDPAQPQQLCKHDELHAECVEQVQENHPIRSFKTNSAESWLAKVLTAHAEHSTGHQSGAGEQQQYLGYNSESRRSFTIGIVVLELDQVLADENSAHRVNYQAESLKVDSTIGNLLPQLQYFSHL